MRLSIAIPCYEMHGVGVQMLERCLESLEQQTFKDFEVVISDNSKDEGIYNICRDFKSLNILHGYNPDVGMAANTNCAIKESSGELIKILYQDDYLAHSKALQIIIDNFDEQHNWLITACSNNHFPYYSAANTLGSPSVLTIRNKHPLLFDKNLKWVLDLEYYKRLFAKYGLPKLINDVNVIIGIGNHQETNHLTLEEKLKEEQL